jgi:hypothetical protein
LVPVETRRGRITPFESVSLALGWMLSTLFFILYFLVLQGFRWNVYYFCPRHADYITLWCQMISYWILWSNTYIWAPVIFLVLAVTLLENLLTSIDFISRLREPVQTNSVFESWEYFLDNKCNIPFLASWFIICILPSPKISD